MDRNLPESSRSMILEGVPTPIPILFKISTQGQRKTSFKKRWPVPGLLYVLNGLLQLDVLREELGDSRIFGLKGTQRP